MYIMKQCYALQASTGMHSDIFFPMSMRWKRRRFRSQLHLNPKLWNVSTKVDSLCNLPADFYVETQKGRGRPRTRCKTCSDRSSSPRVRFRV